MSDNQPEAGEQPVAKATVKLPPLPTVAECVAAGRTISEAHADVVYAMAKRCKVPDEVAAQLAQDIKKAFDAKASPPTVSATQGKLLAEPYYLCTSRTPKGAFMRIGRKFGVEATKVIKSSLTPAQVQELESTNSLFLTVHLVTHAQE
jgi:hypothetical protein